MAELPKKYNHKETEKKWQKYWQEKQVYKWDKQLSRDETFVIDTPPPTVSGLLHMGHIFSYTQADFVARFQRMKGKTVFYPMGFDDNGLPTERLVEKVKKIKAVNMPREDFIHECQEVVAEAEKEFERLFNSIALSVDWNEKYQTISDKSQKISQLSFIDLYNKGFVERKLEPVLWDIVDRTALSQADLVDKEKRSQMNDIVFKVAESGKTQSKKDLIIATTRPELLLACVAVMVNPEDKRYKYLFKDSKKEGQEGFTGSYAYTALFGVKVPIIADNAVQTDKGTGAVMCCTFGDETDIVWWRKHNLPTRGILSEGGRIRLGTLTTTKITSVPEIRSISFHGHGGNIKDMRGAKLTSDNTVNFDLTNQYYQEIKNLTIKEARSKMLEILGEKGLLKKQEDVVHSTKCAERSGVPIEILVTSQWFIKILNIKEQLKKKAAECNWYPHFMKIRIDQWIDGISWDWCISRQRFFGVPFPVWYVRDAQSSTDEKVIIANQEDLPINPLKDLPKSCKEKYKIESSKTGAGTFDVIDKKDGKQYRIRAETDIMDTWATSSVSPQLSSYGITKDLHLGDIDRHQKLFPADLRPQAHEIIRSWAFYTIVKAYLHEDTIPWKNLMISGWCLAPDKSKMSKSKGNVITPNSLIEEKGSDVIRYWASTSHLGADTAYSESVLKIGNKLLTKLFNAAKFASLNFSNLQSSPTTAIQDVKKGIINQPSDLWILHCLANTIEKAGKEFEQFEYARAREAVEDFFWNNFCDNYLEIVKIRCYGVEAAKYENITLNSSQKAQIITKQQSGVYAIYHCLEAILRLFAPFIPHLTEELYSTIFADKFNAVTSIHSRGTWPKATNYPQDKNLLEAGNIMLKTIAAIRKFKSDRNLSMKTPIKEFTVNSKVNIDNILEDLKNVCNCDEIIISNSQNDELVTKINIG